MTWTRLDDTWTDLPELADLPHDVRWHYLCMIQFCSRTARYDGVLKVADARRCSDIDDPVAAMDTLLAAELIHTQPDRRIKVARIDEHIPPPSVRENSARSKVRMQRMRGHKNGDHSKCLPDKCEHVSVDPTTGEVTAPVTRNTGTGQDRTGRALDGDEVKASKDDNFSDTPSSSEPCFTCGMRPAVVGSSCVECSSGGSDLQHQFVSEATAPDVPSSHHAVPPSCPEHGFGRIPSECGTCRAIERDIAA